MRYLPFLVRTGCDEGRWWASYRTILGTFRWRVAGLDSEAEARAELRKFVTMGSATAGAGEVGEDG